MELTFANLVYLTTTFLQKGSKLIFLKATEIAHMVEKELVK